MIALTPEVRDMLPYRDMFTCEQPGGGSIMVLIFASPIGQIKT